MAEEQGTEPEAEQEPVFEPPPIIGEDGEELFTVEKIVAQRTDNNGHKHYKINWRGYDSSYDTWRKGSEIKDSCKEAIQDWIDQRKAKEKARKLSRKTKRKLASDIGIVSASSVSTEQLDESNMMGSDTQITQVVMPDVPNADTLESRPLICAEGERPGQLDENMNDGRGFASTSLGGCKKMRSDTQISRNGALDRSEPVPHVDPVGAAKTVEKQKSVDAPAHWQELQKLVDAGHVRIQFCDLRYSKEFMRYDRPGGVVYVMDTGHCKSLEQLEEEDIQWPYLMYRDERSGARYLLVKVKNLPERTVAAYMLDAFIRKFPEIVKKFHSAFAHFQTMYSTTQVNIDRFEKALKEFNLLWPKIEDLTDEEKVLQLPMENQDLGTPASEVVDNYLQMMENTKRELYFHILGRKFGDLQSHSACGIGVLMELKKFYNKRERRFAPILEAEIANWINSYEDLYRLPG